MNGTIVRGSIRVDLRGGKLFKNALTIPIGFMTLFIGLTILSHLFGETILGFLGANVGTIDLAI